MSVTQREIAAKLNMSQAHVARALSGKSVVSLKTRLRVEAAAREMGYDPTAYNRAVAMNAQRHGKTFRRNVIAVMFPLQELPGITSSELRSVPFYAPVLQGMDDEAAESGVDICLCLLRNAEIPRLIREKSVDGVIVMSDLESIHRIDLPRVVFHFKVEGAHCVSPDDRDGARQATRHLLELGHRRIAYLGVWDAFSSVWDQRLKGYRDAMHEYGLEVRDEWMETSLPWPKCTPAADDPGCGNCVSCCGWAKLTERNGGWKKRKPPFTAMVCHNDIVAMGAIVQAKKTDVHVPRDLSVIGFDDVSSQYQFNPALTSVSLPLYEMGREAVRMIQDAVENGGGQGTEYRHRMLPVSLVVRDSTSKPSP